MELAETVAVIDPAYAEKGTKNAEVRIIAKTVLSGMFLFMRLIMHKKSVLSSPTGYIWYSEFVEVSHVVYRRGVRYLVPV